jgi:hypothetical protein
MGCSVLWKSQLQTSIATSTMESEYTTLSMALRAAIPLLDICVSINHGLGITKDKLLTFKTIARTDLLHNCPFQLSFSWESALARVKASKRGAKF